MKSKTASATLVLACGLLGGCRQDMHNQPKYRPLQASTFWRDQRSERPLIEGTVARGFLRANSALYTGKMPDGKTDVTAFPIPVTQQVMERGRERFDIYCSPCHGRTGDGYGVIVTRGFQHPPSYHTDRLRNIAVGHMFDVITNGYGAMQSYASRVEVQDRWAIISYIRALQLARNVKASDLPQEQQQALASVPDWNPSDMNEKPHGVFSIGSPDNPVPLRYEPEIPSGPTPASSQPVKNPKAKPGQATASGTAEPGISNSTAQRSPR